MGDWLTKPTWTTFPDRKSWMLITIIGFRVTVTLSRTKISMCFDDIDKTMNRISKDPPSCAGHLEVHSRGGVTSPRKRGSAHPCTVVSDNV
jgi:hypothetical protein